jgi:hypothetical protein
MAILRIVKGRVDHTTYDAVDAHVDIARKHPLGLIMHGTTEVEGTMQVAQVWESEEYAKRFDEEQLAPALRAVGAPTDADITTFELDHLVTP